MNSKIGIKKLLLIPIAALVLIFSPVTAQAVPTLQLDIEGGTYVGGDEESTITYDSSFNLLALYTEHNGVTVDPNEQYFISIAITPDPGTDFNSLGLGSFSINGTTVQATTYDANTQEGMTYGNPPYENIDPSLFDGQDLSKHGIFPTYFIEYGFYFDVNDLDDPTYTRTPYNVQDDSEGEAGSTMFVQEFWINADNFDFSAGYELHFDLYNITVKNNGDIDREDFAPFSHDATAVPEPATVLLLGLGLLGLWGWTRRFGTATIGK